MTTDAYIKTNNVWQKIETILDRESGNYGLHSAVRDLLNAVKEEREKTSQDIAALRHECMIKGFYIKQLEKVKGLDNESHAHKLERLENDLMNVLNHTSDILARVNELRKS
jgi:ribosome-binding protein aMBF1 (putative translation factor)